MFEILGDLAKVVVSVVVETPVAIVADMFIQDKDKPHKDTARGDEADEADDTETAVKPE